MDLYRHHVHREFLSLVNSYIPLCDVHIGYDVVSTQAIILSFKMAARGFPKLFLFNTKVCTLSDVFNEVKVIQAFAYIGF